MTRGDDPYTTAQALRAALTDRLKTISASSGRSVSQLRRQFAYDRLLARIFTAQPADWILKGGVALIARVSSARYTADVDLVARAASPAAGLDALRQAVAHDLADFFSFRLGEPRALVQGVSGVRVMVVPDERLWRSGYRAVAVDVADVPEKALDGALRLAQRLIEPALNGLVAGCVWDPQRLSWSGSAPNADAVT